MLGQEDLTAYVLDVNEGSMFPMRNARVKWARQLSASASAAVTIASSYTALGRTSRAGVPLIRRWVDELVVYRAQRHGAPKRIFRGPISGTSETGGLLTINAFDEIARATYMPVPVADVTGDAAMIVGRVFAAQLITVPGFEIDMRPCGKTATYRVTDARKSFTLDALKPLEATVDFTCIGDRLVVRGVDDYDDAVELVEGDLSAELLTAQDFTVAPDQVVCYGKDRVVGAYPPDVVLRYAGPTPICKSVERTAAVTVDECVQYAKFLYESLRVTEGRTLEIPNNATLSPLTPVDVDDLVPGRLFRCSALDRMIPVETQLFKLVAVSGQQGLASDSRPRQPNGAFDGNDERGKEYVNVTLQAYAPASATPTVTPGVPRLPGQVPSTGDPAVTV